MAVQAPLEHVMHHPLGVFALLVGISAAVPPLIRRVGLPDLVGVLAAGVLVGPHALNWVDSGSETVQLLSDLGAVYLLFTMGLEIDLEEFNRVKRRSLIYGVLILVIGVCHWREHRMDGGVCFGVVPAARGSDGHPHTSWLSDRAQLRRPEG